MKITKLFILTLVSILILTASFGGIIYAEETDLTQTDIIESSDYQGDTVYREKEEAQKGSGKKQVEDVKNSIREIQKQEKQRLEMEKDKIEADKDRVEEEKNELEILIKKAKEAGNNELVEQLKQELLAKKDEFNNLKQEMKNSIFEMRSAIKKSYTDEEIEALNKIEFKLKEEHKDIKVLPFDSIVAKGRNIKFDAPPVIKGGRTLIPVRAISEGFGAEVIWNSEEREVTIKKGDKEIILKIDSNKAYINGEEIEIDVSPQILNSRTIVPLRFIIENLGLKVKWDSETETIEIEEDTDEEEAADEDTEEDTDEDEAEDEDTEEDTDEEEAADEDTEEDTDEEEAADEDTNEDEAANEDTNTEEDSHNS